jgi:hypothetical protein
VITAQGNDRSARLLVGLAAGSYKHPNNDSRRFRSRFWIATSPG